MPPLVGGVLPAVGLSHLTKRVVVHDHRLYYKPRVLCLRRVSRSVVPIIVRTVKERTTH